MRNRGITKSEPRFTWIEFLILLSILGIIGSLVGRFFYGEQTDAWVDSKLMAMGLDPVIGDWICGAIICLWLFNIILDSKKEARAKGIPVVRKQIWYFVIISIGSMAAFLWWKTNFNS